MLHDFCKRGKITSPDRTKLTLLLSEYRPSSRRCRVLDPSSLGSCRNDQGSENGADNVI